MKKLSKQQALQKKRQVEGWGRVSAFLEPEYVAKAKALAQKHGTLADALRHFLDTHSA